MKANSSFENALSFDEVSEEYDAGRPSYPDELYELVVATTEWDKASAIIEVGSGTGQATSRLAAIAKQVLAVEPGASLCSVGRERLKDADNVSWINSRFEDLLVADHSFDGIVSANAFHWMEATQSWSKAKQVLKPGGGMALWWSIPVFKEDTFYAQQDIAKRLGLNALGWTHSEEGLAFLRAGHEEAARQPGWEVPPDHELSWKAAISAAEYVALALSYADAAALTSGDRAKYRRSLMSAMPSDGLIEVAHFGLVRFAWLTESK